MGFLGVDGKTFLVVGVANRHSVAWHITEALMAEGAHVLHAVFNERAKEKISKRLKIPAEDIFPCNVEEQSEVEALAAWVKTKTDALQGMAHSIAFAKYEVDEEKNPIPFHETPKANFLQAVDISAYSLINLSNALRDVFAEDASVICMSISTTKLATDNYGFMGPIKAMLDSIVPYLAKSFSKFSKVRFNSVNAGPLRTLSSSGIPGYERNYKYAELLTLRKENLQTEEVGALGAFLLSPRSSGITGQNVVIDAGLGINYFESEVVNRTIPGKE